MNGERPIDSNPDGDGGDRALARLYAAQLGRDAIDAERPSPASDARIQKLAHEALERPSAGAAAATPSGWRSWLDASWFRPSLAFAAVASLSIVIVALMPREKLEVEREAVPAATPAPAANAPAPSAGSPATGSGAPVSSAAQPEMTFKAAPTTMTSQAAPSSATSSAVQPRAQAPSDEPPKADSTSPTKQAIGSVTRRESSDLPAASPSSKVDLSRPAAPPASAPPAAPAPPAPTIMAAPPQADTPPGSPARAKTRQAEAASAAAGIRPSPPPNPFPGQSAVTGSPSEPRADKSVEEGGVEKPSLITEPADSRAQAQPLPEVRDSVPTYSNEVRPSIPLPNSYIGPRAPAQDAAPVPPGAGSGPAAAMRAQAMQKRSFEGLTAQVSPSHRDPAEWIKSIQKLRTEGKLEQVTKELAQFRKTFPAYAIPDELKPFAPK